MRELLKAYMLVIYKLTGDCKVDNFEDLNVYEFKESEFEELRAIEKEILNSRKLSENIKPHISVPGSLDKTLLQAELVKNGNTYQLEHEGLI